MAKHLICPDVSEFQRPLDRTYTRDFIIFRVMFGANYLDPKFLANAAAAKRLHAQGRLAGVLLYTVYTADPVRAQFEATWNAIGPRIPPWLTGIMIDVETWRGKPYELSGNHSKRINHLFGMHAHRLASFDSVIAYGNAGDLHELYPGRDRRCRVIVAAYDSALTYRKIRGAIGQQYSDGQAKFPVPRVAGKRLPRTSEPFGHCDHNVFPGIENGHQLVRLLRPEQLDAHAKAPVRRRPVRVTKRPPHRAAGAAHLPHPNGVATPAHHPAAPTAVHHPAAAAPVHQPAAHNALVSRNGAHALVMRDDGTLEIRHRIDPDTLATKGD